MKLEIEKTLVVSTLHITESDFKYLNDESTYIKDNVLIIYGYDYGYLIYIASDVIKIASIHLKNKISKEFINLLKLAKKNKCQYLKIDCDFPEYKGLPVFNY